jgi:hypothetical protein
MVAQPRKGTGSDQPPPSGFGDHVAATAAGMFRRKSLSEATPPGSPISSSPTLSLSKKSTTTPDFGDHVAAAAAGMFKRKSMPSATDMSGITSPVLSLRKPAEVSAPLVLSKEAPKEDKKKR